MTRRRPTPDDDARPLSLSDALAVERTRLANERTLLAYFRTALALVAGAVTLLHFFDSGAARITGWVLAPTALVLLTFGIARHVTVHRRLRAHARVH